MENQSDKRRTPHQCAEIVSLSDRKFDKKFRLYAISGAR